MKLVGIVVNGGVGGVVSVSFSGEVDVVGGDVRSVIPGIDICLRTRT